MDLREYMFRNRITTIEMGKKLDCSRQSISAIRQGKKCSRRLAKDIEALTGGQVTAAEILGTIIPLPQIEEEKKTDHEERVA